MPERQCLATQALDYLVVPMPIHAPSFLLVPLATLEVVRGHNIMLRCSIAFRAEDFCALADRLVLLVRRFLFRHTPDTPRGGLTLELSGGYRSARQSVATDPQPSA